jgi:hypothetical protein
VLNQNLLSWLQVVRFEFLVSFLQISLHAARKHKKWIFRISTIFAKIFAGKCIYTCLFQ